MRLDNQAIKVIVDSVQSAIGQSASVWLFGSRVNDEARGGDIDLLVETDRKLENRVSTACNISAKIQIALGEQRIDVILKDSETADQPIHTVAKQQGIRIC